MVGGLFHVHFLNKKIFDVNVSRALEQVGDLRVPFKLISKDFYKSQEAVFSLQGSGAYPPFQGRKLSERKYARTIPRSFDAYTPYQYYKEKKYGYKAGYPLLVRTGRIADSTTSEDSPESILKITPDTLTIGSSVPYGVFHNSDASRRKIPFRKFLFILPESSGASDALSGRLGRWSNIINQYVLRYLGATLKEATGQ